MLSKQQVTDTLGDLIEKYTDVDQWALKKALDAVQQQVSELGILGALSNAVMIPDVFPHMSVPARSEILSLITRLTTVPADIIPSLKFFGSDDNDE